MKIGAQLYWQNYTDWDRFLAKEPGPPKIADHQVYDEEIHLAGLVEPLGFDSYWTVDHHFTPYSMTGGALQHLTFMAGKTSKIDFGTMIVVLPWYDPLVVVDQVSVLDNLLQGRGLTLGIGRGASKREFDAFRVPMGESRGRFAESLEILRMAMTNEWFSYDGEFYKIPETTTRPAFRNPERILDRMRIAWQSPESLPVVANSGLGVLMTNTKGWDAYGEDVLNVNKIRAGNGLAPTQPTVVVFLSCFETEKEAWDVMSRYALESFDSSAKHYGLDNPSQFANVKGYEQYAKIPRIPPPGESEAADRETIERVARPQAWGTPDMVFEQLKMIQQKTGAEEFVLTIRYGGMPVETAERSMRLFAAEVLPRLHELETPLPDSMRG